MRFYTSTGGIEATKAVITEANETQASLETLFCVQGFRVSWNVMMFSMCLVCGKRSNGWMSTASYPFAMISLASRAWFPLPQSKGKNNGGNKRLWMGHGKDRNIDINKNGL